MPRRSRSSYRHRNAQLTGRDCAVELAVMCPKHSDRALTTRFVPTNPEHGCYMQVCASDVQGRETAARNDGGYEKTDQSLPLTERVVDKRTYSCPVPECRRKFAVPDNKWDAIMLSLARPNERGRREIPSDRIEQSFRLPPADAARLIEHYPKVTSR